MAALTLPLSYWFLVACTPLYKPLCRSVRRLVGLSFGLSVADCSEHATYGDWPCFLSYLFHQLHVLVFHSLRHQQLENKLMWQQLMQLLLIYNNKKSNLIKHMLSTFEAENRHLDKHTEPRLKKRCAYKKKCVLDAPHICRRVFQAIQPCNTFSKVIIIQAP